MHIILLDPLGEEITRIKSIVVRRICKDEPCLKHIIKAINQVKNKSSKNISYNTKFGILLFIKE